MSSKEDLIKQFSLADEKEKKLEENKNQSADKAKATPDAAAKIHSHGKSGKSRYRKKRIIKNIKSILTDKTLSKMLNVFLFCLIINAVEYFVLINYFGLNTKGVVGKILGLLIIVGYMYSVRLKPRNVGFSTNKRAIFSAVRNGMIFNLALIPAYIVEVIYILLVLGGKPTIRIFAYQFPLSVSGPVYFLANIFLLLLVEIISALMLEVLFRGIIMKMGRAKFGFWQTAVIVSIFYSLWYLIIPLSKISAGYSIPQLLTLCLFYLVLEFSLSIKWCMCTRATGSVWLAFFDHLFFNTLIGLIHIVDTSSVTSLSTDYYRNWRLLLIQAVSIAICFSYYKMKMHKKEQMLQSAGVRSIYSFDSLAEMSEEDVSRQAERIKTADGEIDSEYLKLLEKNKKENLY